MLTKQPAHRAPRAQAAGFSLIELMIAVSIAGVLTAVALPVFNSWVASAKVRAVADSLQNGLRQAQAEAVRRNRRIVFSLTNQTPSVSSTAVVNGTNWAIHALPLVTGDPSPAFVQGGMLTDLASGVTVTSPRSALCFNTAGRIASNATPVVTGADCVLPGGTTSVAFNVTHATAGTRRLSAVVSLGGQVRLCDMDRSLAGGQLDGC
jgi:type IV fimbrial biogenesis protein FimT